MQQPRCHPQVFAGNVEIELLHRVEVCVILIADAEDRNVVDRDLVLANQVQQQIEWTGKDRQLDREAQRFLLRRRHHRGEYTG